MAHTKHNPDGYNGNEKSREIQRLQSIIEKKKEKLFYAAKAAGISIKHDGISFNYKEWNPLVDDGDCAKLEARCSIDVYWGRDEVECMDSRAIYSATARYFNFNNDRDAARRWASTTVAELQGRDMK